MEHKWWTCMRFSTCFGEIMATEMAHRRDYIISKSPSWCKHAWAHDGSAVPGANPGADVLSSWRCLRTVAGVIILKKKCFKFEENLFSSEMVTQSHCTSESISEFMWNSQHLKFPSCFVVQMRSFLQEEKCLISQFYL